MAAAQARMMLNHGLGRYERALEDAEGVERRFAAELGARRIMAGWAVLASLNVKVFLADILFRMDRPDSAQQACDAAYRELEGHEHAFSRVLVDFVQGRMLIEQDRFEEASRLLEPALHFCHANDVATMVPPIFADLCLAQACSGDASGAADRLRKAIADRLHLAGGRYNEFYLARSLATALMLDGDSEGALAAARSALAAAGSYGQQGHEAESLVLLGDIEARVGRLDAAATSYERAQSLAHDCSMLRLERIASERLGMIGWPRSTIAAAVH
jgi:tetratricopeptide (TPR) repeat protein